MRPAGYLAALHGELFIAARSRAVKAVLLIPPLFAFGRVALGKMQGVAQKVQEAVQGGAARPIAENAYGPITDGLAAGLSIGLLLLLALSATSLAGDRDLGVIRLPLTRRVSREGLVLAKFTALCAIGLLSLLLVVLASSSAGAVFYKFGGVVEDGYEIFSASEVRREIALGLLAAGITLPATAALGLVVSAAARSATESAAVAIPLVLAFDVLKGLAGEVGNCIFLSFQPTLLDHSYLKEVTKLARGFSDAGYTDELMRRNLAVPLPEAVALLVVALWIVRRRKM
jgi:ABC-type transport system involved in multi-copper enzyme maturation permease subunit